MTLNDDEGVYLNLYDAKKKFADGSPVLSFQTFIKTSPTIAI